MANKIELKMVINGEEQSYYPKTSADAVMYNNETTVKQAIEALTNEILNLEKVLSINSVYITDENGVLLDDGAGNNLVAVASLVANIEE